jgi:hypothetical protein
LRADVQWEPNKPVPRTSVKVTEGGAIGWPFLMALLAVLLPIVVLGIFRYRFGAKRWAESNLGGG